MNEWYIYIYVCVFRNGMEWNGIKIYVDQYIYIYIYYIYKNDFIFAL